MKIIRGAEIEFTPASHENPQNPGCLKKVLFSKDDFMQGRLQMVNWSILPVGKSFENHYHEGLEEVFIIMSGTVEMTIENEKEQLGRGDGVFVPLRAKHVMKNIGTEDVFYIALGVTDGKGGKTVNI